MKTFEIYRLDINGYCSLLVPFSWCILAVVHLLQTEFMYVDVTVAFKFTNSSNWIVDEYRSNIVIVSMKSYSEGYSLQGLAKYTGLE